MQYEKWLSTLPKEVTEDSVLNLSAYKAALYLSDLCWKDVQNILDEGFYSLADQLYRSTGSISANVTEGYSRNSFKEKARFYVIALGSARESKDWYFKSRHILGNVKALNRMKILTSIIKLLITMINDKRNGDKISEPGVEYANKDLDDLLNETPNLL